MADKIKYCKDCKAEFVQKSTARFPKKYCEKCKKKPEKTCEDADYSMMSVVNSPRMGECGYEGGSIDTERDGVYVLPK